MQTRNPTDFKVIRYILGSTVQDSASPGKDASGDHKLKWTLRSVSGIMIPAGPESLKEMRKKEALQDGIRMIREFGEAAGKWAGINGQEMNDEFCSWLGKFRTENGV